MSVLAMLHSVNLRPPYPVGKHNGSNLLLNYIVVQMENTFYILDEPTTGLHADDISRLLVVLQRFVENGDTVLVIEHNLDVIKTADYIIDLVQKVEIRGGTIIATGTPEEVAEIPESYTGKYLKPILERDRKPSLESNKCHELEPLVRSSK